MQVSNNLINVTVLLYTIASTSNFSRIKSYLYALLKLYCSRKIEGSHNNEHLPNSTFHIYSALNLLRRFPIPGDSTGGINDASPEYDYIDTTFVERKSDSNLASEKAENEISFASCPTYGIHKLPPTMKDTNYDVIN